MQQGRRGKNTFLSPHKQSKNIQCKKLEYLFFRPELCHAWERGEHTYFWLHILSDVPPNTRSHHEFTKLLSNSSFIRGIQIYYDLHPLDLLTFLQRPKLQKAGRGRDYIYGWIIFRALSAAKVVAIFYVDLGTKN